jgi:hypothetical protein
LGGMGWHGVACNAKSVTTVLFKQGIVCKCLESFFFYSWGVFSAAEMAVS